MMRRHSFTALVMLDPAAREDTRRCALGGTLECCLVEPIRYTYFPAVISLDTEEPARAAYALVTITLGDSETRAFFRRGQRFTIWADAVVGHTIQADGLIGYGVISHPVSPNAGAA
jgi:hypothetical protein